MAKISINLDDGGGFGCLDDDLATRVFSVMLQVLRELKTVKIDVEVITAVRWFSTKSFQGLSIPTALLTVVWFSDHSSPRSKCSQKVVIDLGESSRLEEGVNKVCVGMIRDINNEAKIFSDLAESLRNISASLTKLV